MTIIQNLKMSNTYKLFCHCNICLFPTKCHIKGHKGRLQKEAVKILEIEIQETDWKNKNLYMHKGLQFVKLIEEKFKQYNNEERKK